MENYVILNEANFYNIEDAGEEALDQQAADFQFEEDGYGELSANAGTPGILRVEATLNASWSGVRSCHRQSRAARAILGKLEQWANGEIAAHRDLQWLRHGLDGDARYWWRNRRDPVSGRRSCKGGSTFKTFIEFRRR